MNNEERKKAFEKFMENNRILDPMFNIKWKEHFGCWFPNMEPHLNDMSEFPRIGSTITATYDQATIAPLAEATKTITYRLKG
jgi:hypothetical protein